MVRTLRDRAITLMKDGRTADELRVLFVATELESLAVLGRDRNDEPVLPRVPHPFRRSREHAPARLPRSPRPAVAVGVLALLEADRVTSLALTA